ncbi:fumarate hydratase, partial [Mobiluncus curtisii]
KDGVFIEALDTDPGRFMPDPTAAELGGDEAVKIDLNRPMKDVLAELTKYPIKTRLSLTGTLIVARDIAHARLRDRLEKEGDLPQYFKDHPVYYAGPAKTPEGMPSGSFGPTTASRMDPYVDLFQA